MMKVTCNLYRFGLPFLPSVTFCKDTFTIVFSILRGNTLFWPHPHGPVSIYVLVTLSHTPSMYCVDVCV